MRHTGYQSDPLAATMNTRSMGLGRVNPTRDQLIHDKALYAQSKQVNKNRKNEGLVVNADGDSVSIATSVMSSPGIIKNMEPV